MTKKRAPSRAPTRTTSAKRKTNVKAVNETAGKSSRGTAAGLRAGAGSATKAKELTAKGTKRSQKELTKRGGPGRAGNQPAQRSAGAKRAKSPMRARGSKAKAGA